MEVVGGSKIYKRGSNQRKVEQGPQVIEVRRRDTTVQPQKKQKEAKFNQLRVDDSLRTSEERNKNDIKIPKQLNVNQSRIEGNDDVLDDQG